MSGLSRGPSSRAVAAVAAVCLLVAACTPMEDGDDEASDPDAPGSEVAEQPAGEPVAWLEREAAPGLRPAVGELELHHVLGDDAGWMTVGAVTEPSSPPVTAALTSEDGQDWEPLELPEPDADEHRARTAARVGQTWVITGTATTEDGTHLVVWTGQEGDWELVEHPEEPTAGLALHDAVGLEEHAVVVGTVVTDDGASRHGAWTVTPDGEVEPAETDVRAVGWIRDLAVSGDELAAVGVLTVGQAEIPLTLRSDDAGETWSTVTEEPEGLADARLYTVEADGDGWIAGGRVAGGLGDQVAVWRSADLATWEPLKEPEGLGLGHVRGLHRLEGRLLGVGDQLHLTEGEDDNWLTGQWPGPGDEGWFGASDSHDGRVVAVGSAGSASTELYTATSAEEWERIRIADLVMSRAEGATDVRVEAAASDGQRLVAVGSMNVLEDTELVEATFAGFAGDFARAGGPAREPGRLASVGHVEDVGFVAVGSTADAEHDHAGAFALVSEDGEEWSALGVDETDPEDRARVVLPVDDGALVAGMSWNGEQPVSYLWELADDALEPREVPELDGYGVAGGCSGGDVVALVLFLGNNRVLAVSRDGGEEFELIEAGGVAVEGPGMDCAVEDETLLVLVHGREAPELYVHDEEDREVLDADLGAGVQLSGVRHLPGLGWALIGTGAGETDREGRVHVSRDLETWVALGLEADGGTPEPIDLAITGDTLHVLGTERGVTERWWIGVDEIERALAEQEAARDDSDDEDEDEDD